VLAVCLPGTQEHLGVAPRAEGMTARLELRPQRTIVVDLAVEDEPCALVAAVHRLMPGRREVDD